VPVVSRDHGCGRTNVKLIPVWPAMEGNGWDDSAVLDGYLAKITTGTVIS